MPSFTEEVLLHLVAGHLSQIPPSSLPPSVPSSPPFYYFHKSKRLLERL